MSIVDDLRSIVSPRKRGNGPLEVARKGTPIVSPGGTSSQTGGGSGGLAFPITERLPASTVDVYRLTSADSVWTFEYPVQLDLTDGDGNGGQFYPADYSQWEAG